MQGEEARRAQAFEMLATFTRRILPGTIRRIAIWKGIHKAQLAELADEVQQELALDCLLHTEAVLRLGVRQRNARWMRTTERWIYRFRMARGASCVTEDTAAPQRPVHADVAAKRPEVVVLGNGRLNLAASAAHNGTNVRRLRVQIERLAQDLGCDAEYYTFWRLRAAEALTGLAADLLRDRGLVHVLPARRGSPDPGARLRRIRRIAARFHVRPATLPVRRVLRHWTRRPRLDGTAPRRLLEHATRLHPDAGSAWAWLFEACVADGDLRAAWHALRECRRTGGSRAMQVLARARVLERRGRWHAACALLARAAARWPDDARLAEARRVVHAFSGPAR